MSETMRWCAGCAAETVFEIVVLEDCTEDELGCVDCGSAIVVGVLVPGRLDLTDEPTPDWPALSASAAALAPMAA